MLVTRLDTGIIKSYRETAEGFLDLHLTFSKCGALTYQRADGSFEDEHLTETDLFDEDSLATATGKPLCYLHPGERVTKDNVRKYMRGATGTKIIKDGIFATIVATVHDGELIDVIKTGKAKEVSAAYTAKAIKSDDGRLYQKSRIYEHFAIVPVGRAGADVRAHYDGLNSNRGENVGIQVTRSDELADLRAAELGARDRYISKLRRDSGSSGTVVDQARKGKEQILTTAPSSDSTTADAATDARAQYIARLRAGGKR